jgi:hypothetical protein
MPQSSLTALPQDLPVPKGPTFGRIERLTILFQTLPPQCGFLGTATPVRVLRDQMCLVQTVTFNVRSMEIHQARERGGQPDLERTTLI